MGKTDLNNFFVDFLNKEPLIINKHHLQSSHNPAEIPHRDAEIQQIAKILAPSLRLEKPSNVFIYGKTGTGKTCVVNHVCKEMENVAKEKKIMFEVHYINCKLKKVADTEYRLIAHLARQQGKQIPPTGLPTDEVYKVFFKSLDESKKMVILILDEIDQLVKKTGDEILYNLTRINAELMNAQISVVGISNDLLFANHLDPRVKSSLSEEELVFPPYNALQLQDILKARSKGAFRNGAVVPGAIEKCAAYAARDHGDARRALDLLRVAAEVAERNGSDKVMMEHIDLAEEKIEKDRVLDLISTQPQQHQAALYSIIRVASHGKKHVFTGEVYDLYKEVCSKTGLRPLTQRRISDIIGEFDMLGIINAKVISKGRYGRTREISISVPNSILLQSKKELEEGLNLA